MICDMGSTGSLPSMHGVPEHKKHFPVFLLQLDLSAHGPSGRWES